MRFEVWKSCDRTISPPGGKIAAIPTIQVPSAHIKSSGMRRMACQLNRHVGSCGILVKSSIVPTIVSRVLRLRHSHCVNDDQREATMQVLKTKVKAMEPAETYD